MAGGLVQPTSPSFLTRLPIPGQLRESAPAPPESNQEPGASDACGVRLPCGVRSKGGKLGQRPLRNEDGKLSTETGQVQEGSILRDRQGVSQRAPVASA